jgi:hypothetical protein
LVLGVVGYYVTLPLIRAYQNRRRGALAARIAAIKHRKQQAKEQKSRGH